MHGQIDECRKGQKITQKVNVCMNGRVVEGLRKYVDGPKDI